MKNTTNNLERLPASAGSPTNAPKVWCKCEVCGWLEEFPALNLNMEQCTIEFCEDCNLARVFDLA